ncbi:MAG: hypothetical protein WEA36_09965 [Balneolaceae bacterium]
MERHIWSYGIGAILLSSLLTGCYTQVQTIERERVVYLPQDREQTKAVQQEQALDSRVQAGHLEEDPNYLYPYEDGHEDGYEDGWVDAESYYFIDYEARNWYDRHAVYGVRPVHVTQIYHVDPYGPGYWGRPWMGYRPWPNRGFFHLNLAFGSGYHVRDPWYGWHSWYDYGGMYGYTRYPFGYGGWTDSYWSGFHHGYGFGISTGVWSGPARDYAVRTSGLNSTTTVRSQRTRGSGTSPQLQGRPTQMRGSAGSTRTVRSRTTARPTTDTTTNRSEIRTPQRVERRTRATPSVSRSTSGSIRSESSTRQRVRTPRTRQIRQEGTLQYRPSSNGSGAVRSTTPNRRRQPPAVQRSTPQNRSNAAQSSGNRQSSSQRSSDSSSGRSR